MIRERFSDNIAKILSDEKWLICQDKYEPALNRRYETNFTLSNGYMGIRGIYGDGNLNDQPGNFIAGIFNKSEAQVRELVNVQNFIGMKVYINDALLNLDTCKVIDFIRVLDMKKGLLAKAVKLKDEIGRITLFEEYRFISKGDMHRSAVILFITPLNYSEVIAVENIIDGSVTNSNSNPKNRVKHLKLIETSDLNKKGCYLETATREDSYKIGTGTCMKVSGVPRENKSISFRKFSFFGEEGIEYIEIDAKENETLQVDKFAITYTSRDAGENSIKSTVEQKLEAFFKDGIQKELQNHSKAYEKIWDMTDISIEGDEEADKALRFNIFHLISCVNEKDPRVSIAAKALHGEGYKGHVFWDTEIYMLPFFFYTYPEAAKTLLMFRYNTLEAAKKNALENGNSGAQFPWEAADTGLEETPKWGLDYLGNPVRIWTGEIECHITADIAFAIYEYVRVSGDTEFMLKYGVEVFLETARFWVSRLEYNNKADRYEINGVIGPDEFHEHVDNNCYTNYMARWNILKAMEILKLVKRDYPLEHNRIVDKVGLTKSEIAKWEGITSKIYIPFNPNDKLIEQFDGYFKRKEYLISDYDENNMPVWPVGVDITKLNETKLVKQADVIMLMLLLDEEFDDEIKRVNYKYYEKRTMHKSSLSPSMYSIMGLKVGDTSKAYQYFMRTAKVDLIDNQGNTGEGIHAASLGGTWQVAIFGFAGVSIDKEGVLCINPWLPEKWERLSFKLCWSGSVIQVEITKKDTKIKLVEGMVNKVKVNGDIKVIS